MAPVRCSVFAIAMVLVLGACRITQTAGEGGGIVSSSGSYDCSENQTCVIELEAGVPFNDTFTAVPRAGYLFDGWQKAKWHLCGAKTTPCVVSVPASFTSLDIDTWLIPQFSIDPDYYVSGAGTRFIYAATSASDSEYFNDLGITLEQSYQYIIRYDLDSGEAEQIDSNYSPSYAESTIYPYTVDDRYMVRREWDTHHDFVEYEPVTQAYVQQVDIREGHTDGCSEFVPDAYFYKAKEDCDPFFGCTGGGFRKLDLSSSGSTFGDGEILPENQCYGYLGSTSGNLYDSIYIHEWDGTISAFGFYRRDQVSGVATPIAEFTQPDGDLYNGWGYSFHYDGNNIFVVREKVAGGIEILVYRQGIDSLPFILYESGADLPSDFNAHHRDVDGGYVVVADQEGFILVYNANDGTVEYIDFETFIYDVQFLHITD